MKLVRVALSGVLVVVGSVVAGCAMPDLVREQREGASLRDPTGSPQGSGPSSVEEPTGEVLADGGRSEGVATVQPPFTVEEVRAACPVGTVWVYRTTSPGRPSETQTVRVIANDDDEVGLEVTTDRGNVSESVEVRGRWEDWTRYDIFSTVSTQVLAEQVELPLGRLDCRVYRSRKVEDGREIVARFDYAVAHPGPPARIETTLDGEPLVTRTLESIEYP
ncbi:MAG: hypothetical protein KDC38_05745 [Planctomycetes bacterium]|nr:hypothetical protein [Planctomycetota bacterium]